MKQLRIRVISMLACTALLLTTLGHLPAAACSSVELESKEGDVFWFRTCDMDDGYNVFGENGSMIQPSYLVSYPKGVKIPFTLGAVIPKHSVIGMSFSDSLAMLDGINDAGLICGLQNFEEGTQRPLDQIPADGKQLAAMEAVTWFLAQCADVEQVRDLAGKTYLNASYVKGVPGSDYEAWLHLFFTDAKGNCIVLEASNPEKPGQFEIYESNGVMTNSPTYPKLLGKLSQYTANSPELRNQKITDFSMENVDTYGKPTEDMVFPASWSSPDRFIRLSVMRYLTDGGKQISSKDMLVQGSLLLNSVFALRDNGRGTYYYRNIDENGNVINAHESYTQYTVCYDSARQTVAIRPYDSSVWTSLSMKNISSEKRETYQIHRGTEGSTVEAKSS